jgi:hypothetical protein
MRPDHGRLRSRGDQAKRAGEEEHPCSAQKPRLNAPASWTAAAQRSGATAFGRTGADEPRPRPGRTSGGRKAVASHAQSKTSRTFHGAWNRHRLGHPCSAQKPRLNTPAPWTAAAQRSGAAAFGRTGADEARTWPGRTSGGRKAVASHTQSKTSRTSHGAWNRQRLAVAERRTDSHSTHGSRWTLSSVTTVSGLTGRRAGRPHPGAHTFVRK